MMFKMLDLQYLLLACYFLLFAKSKVYLIETYNRENTPSTTRPNVDGLDYSVIRPYLRRMNSTSNIVSPSTQDRGILCNGKRLTKCWLKNNGRCLWFCNEFLTFQDAEARCQDVTILSNGHLLSLNDSHENAFIAKKLHSGLEENFAVWLGAKRTALGWNFTDHQPFPNASEGFWATGQPREDQEGYCGVLSGKEGKWITNKCTEKHVFICYSTDFCNGYKYSTLDEPNRHISAGKGSHCDNELFKQCQSKGWKGEGWYRLTGRAGTTLPEESPGVDHCGALFAGWLNGKHPTIPGARLEDMKVCFDTGRGPTSCFWSVSVAVKNCGYYYIYHLPAVPGTLMRYCGV